MGLTYLSMLYVLALLRFSRYARAEYGIQVNHVSYICKFGVVAPKPYLLAR